MRCVGLVWILIQNYASYERLFKMRQRNLVTDAIFDVFQGIHVRFLAVVVVIVVMFLDAVFLFRGFWQKFCVD